MICESTKNGPRKGEPRYWATGMIKNNTFPEVPDELMGQTFPCLGMHTFRTACDNCIPAFRFIGFLHWKDGPQTLTSLSCREVHLFEFQHVPDFSGVYLI